MTKHIPVLMYHNIVKQTTAAAPDWINETLFKEQMLYLQRNGFTSISPQLLLTPEKLPKKPVVITFDDGYEGVYSYAFPVLKELKMQATVFLITSCLGDENEKFTNEWSEGGRPLTTHLSVSMVKEMLTTNLISIGCHSHSHKIFKNISTDEIGHEISISKQIIRTLLNYKTTLFSYPGGYVGEKETTYKILKENKIELAFGAQTDKVENIERMDLLNIHRINISTDNTFTNPKAKHRFEALVNPFLNKLSKFNKLNFVANSLIQLVK
ncbi:MAG: polysaccharide deacetylase family protein [Bacteroidia bacterium]